MSRWIDADALIEKCYKQMDELMESTSEHLSAEALSLLCGFTLINSAPTIEPKRGEWIDEADKYDASFGIHDYRCSNCNSYADEYISGHEWYTAGKPNFCPHCGADMREREGE